MTNAIRNLLAKLLAPTIDATIREAVEQAVGHTRALVEDHPDTDWVEACVEAAIADEDRDTMSEREVGRLIELAMEETVDSDDVEYSIEKAIAQLPDFEEIDGRIDNLGERLDALPDFDCVTGEIETASGRMDEIEMEAGVRAVDTDDELRALADRIAELETVNRKLAVALGRSAAAQIRELTATQAEFAKLLGADAAAGFDAIDKANSRAAEAAIDAVCRDEIPTCESLGVIDGEDGSVDGDADAFTLIDRVCPDCGCTCCECPDDDGLAALDAATDFAANVIGDRS